MIKEAKSVSIQVRKEMGCRKIIFSHQVQNHSSPGSSWLLCRDLTVPQKVYPWLWIGLCCAFGVARGAASNGGYYVKLLEVPSICPFNDFCLPWVPKWSQVFGWDDPEVDEIRVFDNALYSVSYHDFAIVKWRGTLKSTYHCRSKLRQEAQVKMWQNSPHQVLAWCQMFPDTLGISCGAQRIVPSNGNLTRSSVPFGKLSRSSPTRHLYIVPLSCVHYRSSFKTQHVFFHRIKVAIKGVSPIDLSFAPNLIEMNHEARGRSSRSTNSSSASTNQRITERFTWERAHSLDFKLKSNDGSVHLRIHPKEHEAVLEWSGFFKVLIRRTHNRVTVLPSLELVLDYLNPLWLDETLDLKERGVLADTGFLSVMTPSFLTNGSSSIVREQDSMTSCLTQRSRMGGIRTQDEVLNSILSIGDDSQDQIPIVANCQCSNISTPELESRLGSQLNPAVNPHDLHRANSESRQLWQQSCCATLLGKIRVLSSLQRKKAGSTLELSNHFFHFNDRLACAQGSEPLDIQGLCDSNFCCQRTQFQVAQWDHRTRGKCWILRASKPEAMSKQEAVDAKKFGDRSRRQYRVQSAAFGIMAIATVFVLTFRLVSRKLEECRPTNIS
ncbi:hypothetical protein TCAL_08270 [Tigriopus californicus]|uniref:Uncharacterized protein n=1 Tax=Tigriopus californicus TaxID=6832 RepID=A0A553N6K8_TIGCA|nr:uncharacterized protein LOC131885513 isoform X2 [Tigriopus californicus]TRY61056.1 hypothetical protein TCAL_08270 [Tigriopus californicus]